VKVAVLGENDLRREYDCVDPDKNCPEDKYECVKQGLTYILPPIFRYSGTNYIGIQNV
jgi:hypothetical protein